MSDSIKPESAERQNLALQEIEFMLLAQRIIESLRSLNKTIHEQGTSFDVRDIVKKRLAQLLADPPHPLSESEERALQILQNIVSE